MLQGKKIFAMQRISFLVTFLFERMFRVLDFNRSFTLANVRKSARSQGWG
jgi:hypothetical protein